MRQLSPWILAVSLFAAACGGDAAPTPTAPSSQVTSSAISSDPDRPSSAGPFPSGGPENLELYSVVTLDEGTRSRVTASDFLCDPAWPHYCRGFLLKAPRDGELDVVMSWAPVVNSYPLDFDVYDPVGRLIWYSYGWTADRRRLVGIRVKAGVTYPITVWSSSVPGEEFELQFSLRSE